MNMTRRSTFWTASQSLAAVALLAAGGCAGEIGDDPAETTSSAFTEAECGSSTYDTVPGINGFFAGPGIAEFSADVRPIITPTTYSNSRCWRGFIAKGLILTSDTTLVTGGGPTAKVTVSWNDALPSNQADCSKTYMVAIVYDRTWTVPKDGLTAMGSQTSRGVWRGFPFNRCSVPPMVFDSATYLQHLQPVLNFDGSAWWNIYMFALTGRAPNGTTRSVRLDYTPPTIIY